MNRHQGRTETAKTSGDRKTFLSGGIIRSLIVIACLIWLSACSPEVGSDKWCAEMKEKPKQDWTAGEAADYTKYCILKMDKK